MKINDDWHVTITAFPVLEDELWNLLQDDDMKEDLLHEIATDEEEGTSWAKTWISNQVDAPMNFIEIFDRMNRSL